MTLRWSLAAGAALALSGCTPPPPPLPERLALTCAVERTFLANGVVQLRDETTRTLYLDLSQGLFAVSAFGGAEIDPDWAAAFAEARQAHGGLAPVVRRTGAFVCFEVAADGVCRHGVDAARGSYALETLAVGATATGAQTSAVLKGQGRCQPAAGAIWPTR